MVIKKASDIKSSEITDQDTYLNRRMFMRGAVLAGSAAATGLLYRQFATPSQEAAQEGPKLANVQKPA